MNRLIVVCAVATILCGGNQTHAQDNYDPAVKKLMPADQLEFAEKLEAIKDQYWSLGSRIKDAKKRGEENEKLGTQMHALQDELLKKVKTEGLKGWVGKCSIIMPRNALVLDSWQPMYLNIKLADTKTPSGTVQETLVAFKINDIVRFSTKPDPNAKVTQVAGKTFGSIGQDIKWESITTVEKAGVVVPAAKSPPAKKK